MKKNPANDYSKRTGKVAFTAQMAEESLLRTEQWLKNGCNAFDAKKKISNPLSFWTEQDVLLYIYLNHDKMIQWRKEEYKKILVNHPLNYTEEEIDEILEQSITYPIASVYGEVVKEQEIDGQTTLNDFGFDIQETPVLKTTGCNRTGCMFCGYGCHLEKKGEGRFEQMKITHPKQYEWIMKPWDEGGLGYKDVIDWMNEHGNLNIKY